MSDLLLSLITFAAYGVLAVYFWQAHVHGDGDLLSRGAIGHLVLIPLAMHGYLLVQDILPGGGVDLGVLHALSLIVWLTLLVYWVARFFYPIGGLQTLVLPLAAVVVVLPELFPPIIRLRTRACWHSRRTSPLPCWLTACSPSRCCTRC